MIEKELSYIANNENKIDEISYNKINKTLIFYSKIFLLIINTYFSIYFNKTYNTNIIGIEFTLLRRIFDEEEEFRSQIINIPLNEYIFRAIKVGSIKIHYYTLYIPENNNIELETNLNNIAFSIKKALKK